MAQKACQEYFDKFPSALQKTGEIKNEDRIKFMLTNPVIRSKLDEWLVTGNADPSGTSNGKPPSVNEASGVFSNINLPGTSNQKSQPDPTKQREIPILKNHELSLKKRKEGNEYFAKKMWEQSIASYHDALRLSKFQTKEERKDASICLANRSAVYYEFGHYDYSLRDANLALENGYPDNLKIKLILRKANIFMKQRKLNSAREMLELGREALVGETGRFGKENYQKLGLIEKEIFLAFNSGAERDEQSIKSDKQADSNRKQRFEENPDFANASNSLGIEYSEKSTRHVICSQPVSVGDVIFQEDPYATVLIPEFYESFCNHCITDLKGYFIPCSSCAQVSYCSAKCSANAWKEYHSHECQSLKLLQSVGIAHLAIRIILIAGTSEVLKTLKNEKVLADCHNWDVFRKRESNYGRVFSLLDHIGDIRPEDLFQYSLTAALLTHFLSIKTSFLDSLTEEDTAKIGGVILRHICQLICNGHAVTAILSDFNAEHISYSTLEETQAKIATGIYPSVSLVNHSCDPNIACSFKNGRTLVVKSTENLERGSEILNCYGPNFRRMNRKNRQENLSQQYFFECDCPPCTKELKEDESFADKFFSYACLECSAPVLPDSSNPDLTLLADCVQCKCSQDMKVAIQSVFKSDEFYTEGMEQLRQGNVKDAVISLLKCYNLRSKALFQDNVDLGEVCDALGRCYAIYGDFKKSAEFVKKSLAHVEKRFGTASIEYSREITKYVDLLNQLGKNDEAMSHGFPSEELIQKSKSIMQLYTAT